MIILVGLAAIFAGLTVWSAVAGMAVISGIMAAIAVFLLLTILV